MFDVQNSSESDFLKKNFSDYYKKNAISSVPDVIHREFGFGVFKRKIANRNLAFSSELEMNYFLREKAPLFFSYSNSYYAFPSRTPTIQKKWLKADLIYEFDADELGLEVLTQNNIQWFNDEHLGEARKQVFRLIGFLENDFNFPASEVLVNFSGKAGYHVHLRWEKISNLNKRARIELVDYLTAQRIDFTNLGFDFDSLICPVHKGLWANRLINGAKEFFNLDPKIASKIIASQPKRTAQAFSLRGKVVSSLDEGKLAPVFAKKSSIVWKKIFEYVLNKEKIPIDRQTSIDLNKIIRVPSTLHGDTGLVAKTISIDSLKSFDPFVDAVVFGEEMVKINVLSAPKFSLKGKTFGPFENSIQELPLFAAIYLIGKGAATLKLT